MGPAQKREDPEWVKAAAASQIYYRVPKMDQVEVRKDLPFKTTPQGPLLFDLYRPGARPKAAPAVILIHGGPIPANLLTNPKDWRLFESFGRLLGASGMAAVTFNHRFFALDKATEALGDIRDLVGHVVSNGGALGVDPGRLCLWVFSGGGIFLAPFLRETPAAVCCIVAYYAVLRGSVPQFSAATQLGETTGTVPPMLIARAGRDVPELNEGIDYFVQQALKKNVILDVLNHATGQHGFDGRDDDGRTREILRRTVQFLRVHLKVE